MRRRFQSAGGRQARLGAATPAIVLLTIATMSGCSYGAIESPDEEENRLAQQDDMGESSDEQPEDLQVFPNTEMGWKLRHHMEILALPAETLEEADRRYEESLYALRANDQEAVTLLAAAYFRLPEEQYFDRWGVIKTMADLESPHASAYLSEVATVKMPPEKSDDLHHVSTQEQEAMIRLRAVYGLRALAIKGNEEADRVLWRVAVDDRSPAAVRVRAIKGYLGAAGEGEVANREKELKKWLPKKLHYAVTLEVTPQEVFIRRVNEQLARIDVEGTADDASEERLPDAEAPSAEPPSQE